MNLSWLVVLYVSLEELVDVRECVCVLFYWNPKVRKGKDLTFVELFPQHSNVSGHPGDLLTQTLI